MGPLTTIYTYRNTDPKQEGYIENASNPKYLQKADSFSANGLYIEYPKEYAQSKERIFIGKENLYQVNVDTREVIEVEIDE